jgi:hypothetical protein
MKDIDGNEMESIFTFSDADKKIASLMAVKASGMDTNDQLIAKVIGSHSSLLDDILPKLEGVITADQKEELGIAAEVFSALALCLAARGGHPMAKAIVDGIMMFVEGDDKLGDTMKTAKDRAGSIIH